jgi:hypothetical protein
VEDSNLSGSELKLGANTKIFRSTISYSFSLEIADNQTMSDGIISDETHDYFPKGVQPLPFILKWHQELDFEYSCSHDCLKRSIKGMFSDLPRMTLEVLSSNRIGRGSYGNSLYKAVVEFSINIKSSLNTDSKKYVVANGKILQAGFEKYGIISGRIYTGSTDIFISAVEAELRRRGVQIYSYTGSSSYTKEIAIPFQVINMTEFNH